MPFTTTCTLLIVNKAAPVLVMEIPSVAVLEIEMLRILTPPWNVCCKMVAGRVPEAFGTEPLRAAEPPGWITLSTVPSGVPAGKNEEKNPVPCTVALIP